MSMGHEQVLNNEVAKWARQGWTVASVTPAQAVVQRKKRLNWLLHLILSLVTGGLWLIVVVILLVNRKVESKVITVNPDGRVLIS